MRLPGFTAEQSLYRSGSSYVTVSPRRAAAGGQPTVAMAQDDTTHLYTVTLDNFWVTYPRSHYTDTVTAAIGVLGIGSAGPVDLGGVRRFVANVSHGGVNVGIATSFLAKNSDLYKIAAGLDNSGDTGCGGANISAVFDVEQTPSPFGIGPIWPVNSSLFQNVPPSCPDTCRSLCDGMVAADGAFVSGADLESMTAAGPSTRTVMYPGTDSAVGCGRNSLYYMTWTIHRDQ